MFRWDDRAKDRAKDDRAKELRELVKRNGHAALLEALLDIGQSLETIAKSLETIAQAHSPVFLAKGERIERLGPGAAESLAKHLPMTAERLLESARGVAPIPMLLACPSCDRQHVDAPDEAKRWTNPPHKSRLCAYCGTIWRPADVPTTGVAEISTRGKDDTWWPGTKPR